MESADLASKTESRGCERIWEVRGDSYLACFGLVWTYHGIHQDSCVPECEVGGALTAG